MKKGCECDGFGFDGARSKWKMLCFNTVTESFVNLTYDVREDLIPGLHTRTGFAHDSFQCRFSAWETELSILWKPYDPDYDEYPHHVWRAFQVGERDQKSLNWSNDSDLDGRNTAFRMGDFPIGKEDVLFSDQEFVVGVASGGFNVWSFAKTGTD